MPEETEAFGFVGLGSIGRPMVESLLRSGVPTVVYDLDRTVVDELASLGAEPAPSLPDLARKVRLVGICVPADPHVRAVLDGPDGLLEHLPEGAVVAIHSTVLPETIRWAHEEARRHGVAVVEAAVTGGFMAAAEGRSTFLLSGEVADIDQLATLLDACGERRVVVDRLGDASRLKLCLNLQTYVTFMGVHEAATLARSLGLPIAALKAAMDANGQLNEMVSTYSVAHEFPPEDLADPAMQETLERYAAIIDKDLDLVGQLADDAEVPAEAAALARRLARRVYFLEE